MIYTQLVLLLFLTRLLAAAVVVIDAVVGVRLQHCFKIYAANASHFQ